MGMKVSLFEPNPPLPPGVVIPAWIGAYETWSPVSSYWLQYGLEIPLPIREVFTGPDGYYLIEDISPIESLPEPDWWLVFDYDAWEGSGYDKKITLPKGWGGFNMLLIPVAEVEEE